MTPDFYSDNFRRFNIFVKNYPGNQVYRIACGANAGDTNWTEVLMKNVGRRMNGLSLHPDGQRKHNTFDQPNNVQPAPFHDAQLSNNGFAATLPPKSVVVLELK